MRTAQVSPEVGEGTKSPASDIPAGCQAVRRQAANLATSADRWETFGVIGFLLLAAAAPAGYWLGWWDSLFTRGLFVLAFVVLGGTDLKAESRRASAAVMGALAEFELAIERLLRVR